MASLQSNLKIITSNTAPTTENLQKGAMAFGKVNDEYKIYGNSTGTEVHEFLALSPEDQAKLANVPENTNQALSQKADQTALDSLTGTVATKADQTTVDSLTETVNGKLDSTAINNIYPLKVDDAPQVGIGDDQTDSNTDTTSLAIGNEAKAGNFSSGKNSHSTAVGYDSTAIGYYSTALGNGSSATGVESIALGDASGATGICSTALGYDSKATGDYSTALGYDSKAEGESSTALGEDSKASGYKSIALGHKSTAEGENSVALGTGHAVERSSISIGSNSVASNEGSIAIGANSKATEANEFSVGNGDMNLTRRITHVADPTNDQDAATKKFVDDKFTTLETTVAGKADTSALANYATKTELSAKADQTAVDSLTETVNGKLDSIKAGTNVVINNDDPNNPIINVATIELPDKYSSTESQTGNVGDSKTGLDYSALTGIGTSSPAGKGDTVVFANGVQAQITQVSEEGESKTYDAIIISTPIATTWGSITGQIANQTDLKGELDKKANKEEIPTVKDSTVKIADGNSVIGSFTLNGNDATITRNIFTSTANGTAAAGATTTADTTSLTVVDGTGNAKAGDLISFADYRIGKITSVDDTTANVAIIYAPKPQEATSWGNITGTLTNQADLNSALELKADKSELPTVNDATVTVKDGDDTVATFTLNQASEATINLPAPTLVVQEI